MEAYIAQTAQAQRVPQVTLAWQGGEPTLMGLDFFRRARAAEEGRVPAGMAVERTLQTNGVLLDDEWCAFLAENDYLVGLSIDGPRELHDAYRHDLGGRPVFDQRRRGRPPPAEARRRVQRALHDQRGQRRPPARGVPLLPRRARRPLRPAHPHRRGRDAAGRRPTRHGDASAACSRTTTADFLNAIFDEWVRRDVGEMFVQTFDGVLAAYVRGVSSLCIFQPTCGEGVALEHNGDLYSCDHFVDPPYLLGNIMETPVGELVRSERQRAFGQAKQETLPAFCRACEYLFACNGECPKNRMLRDARRRARPQLALRRAQGVLRPHGPARCA